jgi:hypothetical protein
LIALLAILIYLLRKPSYGPPPAGEKLTRNQEISLHSTLNEKGVRSASPIKGTVSDENPDGNFSPGTLRFLENLDCYVLSPARNTPQCKAIAELLSRHNLGPDSVKDAYNLAWHAYSLDNRIDLEADLRKASLEFVQSFFIKSLVFRYTVQYGLTNVDFFSELLAIKPTIPFGYCRSEKNSTRTLKEKFSELTNPDMFPEFKLNSNWFSQSVKAAEAHYQLFANQEAESPFFHWPEVEPIRALLTEYGVPGHRFPELLWYAAEMAVNYSILNADAESDRKRVDELATSKAATDDEELRISRLFADIDLQDSTYNAEDFKQERITEWMNSTGMTNGHFFERLFSIVITSSIPRLPIDTDLSPELEKLVRPRPVQRTRIEVPIQESSNVRPK